MIMDDKTNTGCITADPQPYAPPERWALRVDKRRTRIRFENEDENTVDVVFEPKDEPKG